MHKRINLAIAATALSAVSTQAQTGRTIYAPVQEPTENAIILYGKASAVSRLEGKAQALGWRLEERSAATGGRAVLILKESVANTAKGAPIWQAAQEAGVSIATLMQLPPARKSPAG
ncbi:hypothetical protein ACSBM8_02845 [Sphingomonas sp. ASY06-1R]|jgi:hypothetical protein|uniref:hypothetical protein n=1 Tax=Sphingomonas sp. ASY06-1R TaxID=3445771 RepID=UPI003FA1AD21